MPKQRRPNRCVASQDYAVLIHHNRPGSADLMQGFFDHADVARGMFSRIPRIGREILEMGNLLLLPGGHAHEV